MVGGTCSVKKICLNCFKMEPFRTDEEKEKHAKLEEERYKKRLQRWVQPGIHLNGMHKTDLNSGSLFVSIL